MKRNVLQGGCDSGLVMIEGLGEYVPAAQLADLVQRLEDVKRLTRELDVAINAAGAAEQANLCDLVAQVRKQGPGGLFIDHTGSVATETQRCIAAVEAEPEYPDEAPPELMKYINECIKNKDAGHMLHMMRMSVRLTKSEIIKRIQGVQNQQETGSES